MVLEKFKTSVNVRLTLTGQGFDPDDVSRVIGIKPTKTLRVGDPVAKGATLRSKYDLWSLWSQEKECIHVGDEIRSFVDNILELVPRIRAAAKKYSLDIEIGCSIYIQDQVPSINLNSRLLEDITKLGAEIDFDIYNLSEE